MMTLLTSRSLAMSNGGFIPKHAGTLTHLSSLAENLQPLKD